MHLHEEQLKNSFPLTTPMQYGLFCRGFIKGWALGKLIRCDDYFAQLV